MNTPQNPSVPPAHETNSLDEPQAAAKQSLLAPLTLIAIAAITFFVGLGRIAFIGPDEPRYAEIAREMFITGDYISPRLCGCLWFEKPALVYWISAVGYRLFGVSEFAARFPLAITATLTALLLYFAIKRMGEPRLAFITGLVLVTSGLFIGYAHVTSPDMPLATTMALSLLAGFLATRASGQKRLLLWVLSFAAMGLAVLAKGLPGVVLTGAIFVVYFLLMRRRDLINWRECLIGTLAFLLVAAIWYVPVTMRHGWEFIHEFFIRHHFQRFTSNEFGHPAPFYFFFVIAFAGLAPWSAFLLPAAAQLRRLRPRIDARHALVAFAWVWAAVIIIFFSFSGSKLPGYILPAFPALAIIVGDQVESFIAGSRARLIQVAVWATALLVGGVAIGFAFYLHREGISTNGLRVMDYGLPLVITLMAVAALAMQKRRAFIAGVTGVMASVIVCAAIVLLPKLSDDITQKQLSVEAANALRPGELIAFFVMKEYAPVFYSQGRVLCGTRSDVLNALSSDWIADALKTQPSLVIFTLENWRGSLERDPRFNVELLAQQEDKLALRVSLKPNPVGAEK